MNYDTVIMRSAFDGVRYLRETMIIFFTIMSPSGIPWMFFCISWAIVPGLMKIESVLMYVGAIIMRFSFHIMAYLTLPFICLTLSLFIIQISWCYNLCSWIAKCTHDPCLEPHVFWFVPHDIWFWTVGPVTTPLFHHLNLRPNFNPM